MEQLINFLSASKMNIATVLLIGVVLNIVSKALDNSNSGNIKLFISAIGRVGSFIFILISCTYLFFVGRDYIETEVEEYETVCRINAEEMFGGRENLKNINNAVEELNGQSEMFNITDMDSTSEQLEKMIVSLNEDEMAMLASVQ